MGGENNGFFFFFSWNRITVLTFFDFLLEKKIKLKGVLFQNLYENILIRRKLKTKHENPLINSKYIYIYIYSNLDPLLDE